MARVGFMNDRDGGAIAYEFDTSTRRHSSPFLPRVCVCIEIYISNSITLLVIKYTGTNGLPPSNDPRLISPVRLYIILCTTRAGNRTRHDELPL